MRDFYGKRGHGQTGVELLQDGTSGRKGAPCDFGNDDFEGRCQRDDARVGIQMDDTLYVLGSVMGPHPFPMIVRDFQKVIGEEIKEQLMAVEGKASRRGDRLCGRRQQCHGVFLRVHT